MKFSAATILTLVAFASANSCGFGIPCQGPQQKRSLGLTQKPREWINAVRDIYADATQPVAAPPAAVITQPVAAPPAAVITQPSFP